MPESLLEISGITFASGDSSIIYALQDEEGRVFQFKPESRKASYTKFGKHGDYEDLGIIRGYVTILRSNGVLFTFPVAELKNKKARSVNEWKDLLPKGEYEGLYADNDRGLIYVVCKDCKVDKGQKATSGYIFSVSTEGELESAGEFKIRFNGIAALTEKKKVSFRPSALARNNRTNQWYILSSANKQLVVTDTAWKVVDVYPLDIGPFLQPEGMAFDSANNLYISNEGDELSKGNILKFKLSNP